MRRPSAGISFDLWPPLVAVASAALAACGCGSSSDAPRSALPGPRPPHADPTATWAPARSAPSLALASDPTALGTAWLPSTPASPSPFVATAPGPTADALAAPVVPDPPSIEGGSPALPPIACREQRPQPFLVRGYYVYRPDSGWEESQQRKKRHRAAIEYRTRHYGYVDGFGEPTWNRHEPKDFTASGRFFGIRVRMNRKVLVALGCVEEAIVRTCGKDAYVPEVLDGLRTRNTFHDGEVSNHTYGIALDVDPNKNSCCGCVWPLSEWPRCKEPVSSPFERTGIPRCWVDAFERYGFYWLGNDALEDTMHFEFLGDPNRIK